ncbi:MAG: DUF6036 family nucleotidyltransferase [bacterium]
MFYQKEISALNENKVRYMVVGGVALVLHGVVRLTADLDIMLDLSCKNLSTFLKVMKDLGYEPKLPVDPCDILDPKKRKKWAKEKNMIAFAFFNKKHDYKEIDMFIDEYIPFDAAYKRKKTLLAEDVKINIVSFDDLIALKKISAREQDKKDIKMLKELSLKHGKE